MKKAPIGFFSKTIIPAEFKKEIDSEISKLNVKAARILTLMGTILIPLFFLTGIDYLFAPAQVPYFLLLRLAASALCLILYLLARSPHFENYSQLFSFTGLLIAGCSIAAMVRALGYDSAYYAGLNLVYLSSMIVPWGMRKTILACLSVYSAYLVPILLFDLDHLAVSIFISNNQFQLFTIIIAATVSHFQFKTRQIEILKNLMIKKQADEIQSSELRKRTFIANISHDLRTPLSVIEGYTERLKYTMASSMVEDRAIFFLENSIKQVKRLLETLINISLLESKEQKPDLGLYDYTQIIKSFYEPFKMYAENRSIHFTMTVPDQKMVVNADILWIERILGNLLQNAFKFTPDGGSIHIRTWVSNLFVVTEIEDTGCGIADEKLDKIFLRKYQAHDDKKNEGFGLGLNIAKEMISVLGGTISVSSQLNRGTSFRFGIPLYVAQDAAVKNPVADSDPSRLDERRSKSARRATDRAKPYIDLIEADQKMAQLKIDITKYENKKPTKQTVLICEDTPGQLNLLIESLQDEYNLLFARNGYEGLEKLKHYRQNIDCILSDVKMPEMDGLEFCKSVMSQEAYKHIPFIFLTAYFNDTEQIQGLSFGATDYMIKPFNTTILREKLNHWISKREHERILMGLIDSLERKNAEVSKLRSIVSHEIKNPLQVLSFAIQGVKKLSERFYPLSESELKEYWNRLSYLTTVYDTINTVLDTAKIMESDINTANTRHELVNTLLNDALVQTQHHTEDIEISIDSTFANDETVWCDKKMLTQVFVNILRNASEAIKGRFKTGGGQIQISFEKDQYERFKITICDNGVGISEAELNKLFHYQHTTKKDGTGIGLYLSKKILRLHGGDIVATSKPGVATSFSILLPLAGHEKKKDLAAKKTLAQPTK
ncbi:MAG: response regulator [Chitinivibrionales bacterium]|nr:response regulator [Chitinivibrionales bacterium]